MKSYVDIFDALALTEEDNPSTVALKKAIHSLQMGDDGSFVWYMYQARKHEPNRACFHNPAAMQTLLDGKTSIYIWKIFDIIGESPDSLGTKEDYWLLDAIVNCESIKKLHLCGAFDPRVINAHFEYYLIKSKHLKVLDMHSTLSMKVLMKSEDVKFLASGLQKNTSIEELILSAHRIDDEGLMQIIKALRLNPQNKLSKINLFGNNISEIGAAELLKYIQEDNDLVYVNLHGNPRIPDEIINNIEQAAMEKNISRKPSRLGSSQQIFPNSNSIFPHSSTEKSKLSELNEPYKLI